MSGIDVATDVTAGPEKRARPSDSPWWVSALCLVSVIASGCLTWFAWMRIQEHRRPIVVAVSHGTKTVAENTRLAIAVQGATEADAAEQGGPWLADQRLAKFRGVPVAAARKERPAVLPPEERWRFEFDPGLTVGDYADQLDALGVELGVIVDATTIEYAAKLSDSKPKRRTGPREEERRLFLLWTRGDLVAADRVLLANAGINAGDRVVLHFISPATQREAERLETEFAKRAVGQIERTVFGVRDTFRGYELYVKRQQERK